LLFGNQEGDSTKCCALYHYSERGIFHPLFVCGKIALLESIELAAALSALSRMEQEIIFLYYFQRLIHREIGRRYGRQATQPGGVFR